MAPPPVVTGLSPNEGPPGTRITIRGEHFGKKETDLIGLSICGCDCLLSAEWKSENKIIAISGPVKGKGEVIVTTRYGGVGTCNVTFKCFQVASIISPLKESAVWVEESNTYSWGRHSLSPSIYQQDDPLGLLVEETDNNKIQEDDLLTIFPNRSGDIAADNFAPGWFLLEKHLTTSFNDLQAGLEHLKRKVKSQKAGQLSFLKANIGPVMVQIDTLEHLREMHEKDLSQFGTEPTVKLSRAIKETEREARKLFDDVLARRDRAEKTRNALNVLSRFKFLFCLPCAIDRNIKKGEYDIVINDYIRVKNLFHKTDIPLFKSAVIEVDKRIQDLQRKLHTDLETMPITVEQQKRLIRYLVNLEAPYDPAWDAIRSRNEYINVKMQNIFTYHKSNERNDAITSKSNGKTPNSKYNKYNLNQTTPNIDNIPNCVYYTEEMCTHLAESFPDLWKIGQAYFSGELQVKIEAGRQVEFKCIVMATIESFSKCLRAVLMPYTLDKSEKSNYGSLAVPENEEIASYLPDLLRFVRSTYATLIKLDLPSDALDIIATLLLDLRIHCMTILFKQTIERIKQLRETWKIDLSGKYSGITQIPITFLKLIEDVIQIIKESVLSNEMRETLLFDTPNAQKELDRQLEQIFTTYHNFLYNLTANEDPDGDEDTTVSQLIGSPTVNKMHDNKTATWEQKLLITLSNCYFSRDTILVQIQERFTENCFPNIDVPVRSARGRLENLAKMILDQYLEMKSDPLVGTIEPSMYLGHFDWDTCVSPTDIRPYAKECINNLIHVHAEVTSVSAALLTKILPQIVETIAEELYRLMSCVKKFNKYGAQQARIDVGALQEFFADFCNDKAKDHFSEAFNLIPALQLSDNTIIEDVLQKCRTRMYIQFVCLKQQ